MAEEQRRNVPMELRTFTGVWTVERKLYKLYDITLPVPVSFKQIVALILSGIPWWGLMALLHVHFGPPFGHVLWIAPPFIVAWYSNRPVMEGKSLMELATSQIKYLMEPRLISGGLACPKRAKALTANEQEDYDAEQADDSKKRKKAKKPPAPPKKAVSFARVWHSDRGTEILPNSEPCREEWDTIIRSTAVR